MTTMREGHNAMEKMRALTYAEELTDYDFQRTIFQVFGFIEGEADRVPENLCTIGDVHKLFCILINKLNKEDEIPAVISVPQINDLRRVI